MKVKQSFQNIISIAKWALIVKSMVEKSVRNGRNIFLLKSVCQFLSFFQLMLNAIPTRASRLWKCRNAYFADDNTTHLHGSSVVLTGVTKQVSKMVRMKANIAEA